MSHWNPAANGLFAQAVEIEMPDERRAFLDKACGDNPELRADVERLLNAHNDAGSFLERPAASFAPTIATGQFDTVEGESWESSLEFLTPSDKPGCLGTLASYEVIDVVGRGGMGLVLRAHDPKLNRVVAIKVMAPELAANPTAVKRFLREAQASAAVSHDHVVTIHAIDEENRPPFIVMEYVDGLSLQDKVDRDGALELKEILRIAMQTAAGLAAAHKQGLVHRDIKPANILLENGVERVKITDFGLARAVDDVGVTQTGQIAGTPQFMSPEQAQGHPIDVRSDLFSLGSVLYTMCTGRPPFRAETAVAMLRRVTDDTPRPIREVNSDVPDWMEAIIFRLLAKNPKERFQSAAELADLLGQYLAHLQQPSAVPLPPGSLSPRGRQRLARRWAVAAAVLLMLVGGLGFTEATGVTEVVPSIVRIVTGEGTLIVEVDDPAVSVQIDGDELVITGAGVHEVRVRPGKHQVQAIKDGQPVMQELVTIIRGGKQVVKVELQGAAAEPKAEADAPVQEITEASRVLRGHIALVHSVAFTPDGRFVVSAGGDHSKDTALRLWEVGTGAEIRRFLGHRNTVTSVAVSPDGEHLLSGSRDHTIRLWDLKTGKTLRAFEGHAGEVYCVGFSPDGRRAASGSHDFGDNTIRLWDVQAGKELRRIEGHTSGVMSVAFSPEGRRIASGSLDGTVRLWDAETGRALRKMQVNPYRVYSVAFSPNGKYLLSGSGASDVKAEATGVVDDSEHCVVCVWDAETGRLVRRLTGHRGAVHGVAFSPDGSFLVSASGGEFYGRGPVRSLDNTVRLWDLATGRELYRFVGHDSMVKAVAVSPDGRSIASASFDATVRLWEVPLRGANTSTTTTTMATPKLLATLANHNSQVRSLAFAPDGTMLATGAGDGAIRLWDTGTWQLSARWHAHNDWVNGLAFSPDGLLASAGLDSTVKLWHLQQIRGLAEKPEFQQQTQPLATLAHNGRVVAVAFSGDGKTLASTSDFANEIRLWDVETRTLRKTVPEGANSLAFCAPEGVILVSGSPNPVLGVRFWDARTGERIQDKLFEVRGIHAVAISGDGTWIAAAGGADAPISVKQIITGELEHAFTGHKYHGVGPVAIMSVAFSPNRRWLASGSGNQHHTGFGELKVWDMWTGRGHVTLNEHKKLVWSVAFSPDGSTLAAASADGSVRIWQMSRLESNENIAKLGEISRLEGHTKRPMELLFLADGRRALSSSGDGTIRLWDVETGEVIRQFVDETMEVANCLALSGDERLLISGHGPDQALLRIWEFESGKVLHRIKAHQSPIFDVGFIPGNQQVVSVAYDNYVRFWDLAGGQKVGEFGPLDGVNCLAVAPNGNVLVGRYNRLQVIEFPNFGAGRELTAPDAGAADVAVSTDGRLAASASPSGVIHLWNLRTGEQLARLEGHADRVEVVTFTPDGRHLISGSWDRTLRVWDLATYQEVARETTQHRVSLELTVSPDGRTVLAGGGEWWDNDNKKWVAENDYDLRLWRLPKSVWPKADSEDAQRLDK